jgi:hypothetical protein
MKNMTCDSKGEYVMPEVKQSWAVKESHKLILMKTYIKQFSVAWTV